MLKTCSPDYYPSKKTKQKSLTFTSADVVRSLMLVLVIVVRDALVVVGQRADVVVGVAVHMVPVAVHHQRQDEEASHNAAGHGAHGCRLDPDMLHTLCGWGGGVYDHEH